MSLVFMIYIASLTYLPNLFDFRHVAVMVIVNYDAVLCRNVALIDVCFSRAVVIKSAQVK